ncbi:PstS family phosphate ABC transporter substrate-binding protein [Kitasatospora sp. NPDC008115]|uniref:PstS family phosphate ABC transporter substrate-binding protein n=1 Tax=Kitasatospora sp. NPDC008115 TaxID=3364022 RepID=UPI0036EDA42F
MRKTAAKLLAVAAIATSVATIAGGTAVADPAAGVTPAATDIVGVGSDTTQALFNKFSTDYNAFVGASGTKLYSYDATGTSPITPKSGALTIPRPNGSGAGITALNANNSATLDFARSSRGPKNGTGGDPVTDLFIAYAKDAVSWAALSTGSHAPANLTTDQLTKIYNCTYTTWNQIDPSLSTATIKAFLPQNGSGTRAFFLQALGLTNPGTCIQATTVQENRGTDAVLNDVDAIVPYSAAHYIGQVYNGHSSGTDAAGPLSIRSIDGAAPVDPLTNTLSATFANSAFGRSVYNVVRQADWNAGDARATALKAIFSKDGWICKNATAIADIKSYGFRTLPGTACGTISVPTP